MPLSGLVAAGPEETFSVWVWSTQEVLDKPPKSTTRAATINRPQPPTHGATVADLTTADKLAFGPSSVSPRRRPNSALRFDLAMIETVGLGAWDKSPHSAECLDQSPQRLDSLRAEFWRTPAVESPVITVRSELETDSRGPRWTGLSRAWHSVLLQQAPRNSRGMECPEPHAQSANCSQMDAAWPPAHAVRVQTSGARGHSEILNSRLLYR